MDVCRSGGSGDAGGCGAGAGLAGGGAVGAPGGPDGLGRGTGLPLIVISSFAFALPRSDRRNI